MPKSRNMGRRSHQEQDVEFEQNIAGLNDELGDQPARPTVHPQQATKSSGDQPLRRHSRRGE